MPHQCDRADILSFVVVDRAREQRDAKQQRRRDENDHEPSIQSDTLTNRSQLHQSAPEFRLWFLPASDNSLPAPGPAEHRQAAPRPLEDVESSKRAEPAAE